MTQNTKKTKDVLMIIFILMIAIAMLFFIVNISVNGFTNEYKYTKEVDCFDRYGNRIANQVCYHRVSCGVWNRYEIFTAYPCEEGK